MSQRRPIEIVGGGLAGLSLGYALRRHGVEVTLHEAGCYPRHRVCGEFIAGVRPATLERLGISTLVSDAQQHREIVWFDRTKMIRRQRLSRPALAISRYVLDHRLAEAFVAIGGTLQTRSRIEISTTKEGQVLACGRKRASSPWIGLKAHVQNLELKSDLEVHLGRNAYVGLCAVEDGAVNVCGLFRQGDTPKISRNTALMTYLRLAGLDALASRLKGSTFDPASYCAVSAFSFSSPETDSKCIQLGDTFAMIPPFTGHGMTVAFQSAETALPFLLAYTEGRLPWTAAVEQTNAALRERLNGRLKIARGLHPFLVSRGPQMLFRFANRSGLLPLRTLASAVHD